MFAADLSWTAEAHTEKVGERRERIARERGSIRSATPSVASPRSSRSSRTSSNSISEDRELWWSSFRKAKDPKQYGRTSRSGTVNSATVDYLPRPSTGRPYVHELRDPSLQPSYTYISSLSSKLPSGASLDPVENSVPELEGDLSSRYSSSSTRSSHERRWSLKLSGKIRGVDDISNGGSTPSPRSLGARSIRRSSEASQADEILPNPAMEERKRRNRSAKLDDGIGLADLKVQEEPIEDVASVHTLDFIKPSTVIIPPKSPNPSITSPSTEVIRPSTDTTRPHTSGFASSKLVAWEPRTDWNALRREKQELEVIPTEPEPKLRSITPMLDGIEIAHSSLLELTRFQRFIRRMENASPKVILDRLKEEWDDPVDEEASEEMQLEKRLWVLTAFKFQNKARLQTLPEPRCNTGKVLEMYGTLADVHQLSATHPRQRVQYLSGDLSRRRPLPGNASYTMVTEPRHIPYPWPDNTFCYIRASTLPSLVPSSELPQLLHECYRLLAPGGLLEIRIMDAVPNRRTAGPLLRAWVEDRLSVNLEKMFRCSKPCMLFPSWVVDAGFELPCNNQVLNFPCAVDEYLHDIDSELQMLVGRALWKDIWGPYVDDTPGEPKYWWEVDDIVEECLDRRTVFECRAIFAYKP